MSHQSRRVFTPGASRKRKAREAFDSATSAKPVPPLTAVRRAVNVTNAGTTPAKGSQPPPPQQQQQQQPLSSNHLLAGHMAYEFLTKGTLLGRKFDWARAEAAPVNSISSADSKRNRPSQIQSQADNEAEPSGKSTPPSYAEVSRILRSDGAHIPGIVNPTQLVKWIQM